MTAEDIELLLKDLCARLPHRPKAKFSIVEEDEPVDVSFVLIECLMRIPPNQDNIFIKPYLRPMSSMTEEERKEYNEYLFYGASIGLMSNTATAYELTDWLNAHHFDYRGLIPMGLALEAPEGMYQKGE